MGESKLISSNRIETIDVLRGFALAGILYAHMIIWYTGASLPREVYFSYLSTADYVAFAIFGALVFGKFYSVFSFLFGLGFYLHFRRKKSESGYVRVYAWRLFLLFIIGIIHHTIWRGDILAIYAVLGIILIAFRRLPVNTLIVIALVLITNLPNHLYDAIVTENTTPNMSLPMEAKAESYNLLVDKGSFLDNITGNLNSW
ncbi:hypothetical protein LZ575_01000 [Antarcticibacterium sp. 1MA-6-2]|uniref:DUF418 domain-containing protein n=1 Tax=Antarcticibacterium sp. 1MA-6-2 TaxID=2908210 RepID=UPI001F415704|nr:hypothetical protein [Antarcticibacterium sp. 1MA-6-2]UJH91395.1 hypothetical protein LZ575_01000 [Antarcticibacterium sp. 1MA-6-2]